MTRCTSCRHYRGTTTVAKKTKKNMPQFSENAYREPVEAVEAETFAGPVSGEKSLHFAEVGVRQLAQEREEVGVLRRERRGPHIGLHFKLR